MHLGSVCTLQSNGFKSVLMQEKMKVGQRALGSEVPRLPLLEIEMKKSN